VQVPPLLKKETLRAIERRMTGGRDSSGSASSATATTSCCRHDLLSGVWLRPEPQLQGEHRYYFHPNGSGGKPLERHFANVPPP